MILVSSRIHHEATEGAPAMTDGKGLFGGLPALGGKPVRVAFDGGRLTSDGGALLLAAVERRLGNPVSRILAVQISSNRNEGMHELQHNSHRIFLKAAFLLCGISLVLTSPKLPPVFAGQLRALAVRTFRCACLVRLGWSLCRLPSLMASQNRRLHKNNDHDIPQHLVQ
jgi:hypothetical protein